LGASSEGGVAVPTFYLDANVPVAVSQALAQVRGDILYPGALGCPVMSTIVPDVEWLEIAGRQDWVVVTKDRKIRSRSWERDALIAAGVRTFCATHAGNYARWELLQLFVAQWNKIEEIATHVPGPYIYSVTKKGVRFLTR
jgi:PIN like domain